MSSVKDRCTIKLAGQAIEESRKWSLGDEEFEFEGHPAKVAIDTKYGGLGYGSRLHLDDRYVEPLRR